MYKSTKELKEELEELKRKMVMMSWMQNKMGKCVNCGVETQAFKIHEGGEWNWYCGWKCLNKIKKKKFKLDKLKKQSYSEQLKMLTQ